MSTKAIDKVGLVPLDDEGASGAPAALPSDSDDDEGLVVHPEKPPKSGDLDSSEGLRRRPVLEERKEALGGLFGIKAWGHHVARKPQSSSIREYSRQARKESHVTVGNVLYTVLVGWWLSFFFVLMTGLLYLTILGRDYARLCWKLKTYLFWPFGTYVLELQEPSVMREDSALLSVGTLPRPALGPYILWLVVFFIFVLPVYLTVVALCWFFVVTIPMAKLNFKLIKLLIVRPHSVAFADHHSADIGRQRSMFIVYQALNPYYFRYSLHGMNIVFLNLSPLVALRVAMIIATFAGADAEFLPAVPRFVLNILCTVPITFYIGMAISSIAVQTNYMIGAILNASFGSITELLLFTMAIRKGAFTDLILYSLTGSLLCDMLLLPGLSMICGGIKYREQKFNPSAAGVGSLLLFIAIIGAFTPTIFFHVFGGYVQDCEHCSYVANTSEIRCWGCHYAQIDLRHDPTFLNKIQPLTWISTALLPIAYIIGMIFTFKTHAHIFKQEDEDEGHGEAPEWSILVSVIIMSVAVACHGLISEDLVSGLEGVLHALDLEQSFLGITVIALTPAATEIANAVKFALNNQISLSVEIGSASSVQVALIQMPMLNIIATIFSHADESAPPFNLLFPLLNVFAVILAVITFNYISTEGKTNYFVGSSMIIMYLLLISAFFFVPESALPPLPGNNSTGPSPPHLMQAR